MKMTTTDFISDLQDRMADDGFALPPTWRGRMESLIAGAIDGDDAQDLARCCGMIADSRAVTRRGPSFGWIAETLAEPAEFNQAFGVEAVGEVLLTIAKYADGEGED